MAKKNLREGILGRVEYALREPKTGIRSKNLSYTASPVAQAIEILVDAFEGKMPKKKIKKAVGYLARILPHYEREKEIEEALNEYESACSQMSSDNFLRFLAGEVNHVNKDFSYFHPCGIRSRAFLYRTDVDRNSLHLGRSSFPERVGVDRTGERMTSRQEVAYRILEDIR